MLKKISEMAATIRGFYPSARASDESVSYLSGITRINNASDSLFKRCLDGDHLDSALKWLREESTDQNNSDVWAYSQHWETHRADLQQRLRHGTFQFQPVYRKKKPEKQPNWQPKKKREQRRTRKKMIWLLKSH